MLHGREAVVTEGQATGKTYQVTFGDIILPPGSDVNDAHAFSETLRRVATFDIGGGRSVIETLADKRIAMAAGVGA